MTYISDYVWLLCFLASRTQYKKIYVVFCRQIVCKQVGLHIFPDFFNIAGVNFFPVLSNFLAAGLNGGGDPFKESLIGFFCSFLKNKHIVCD